MTHYLVVREFKRSSAQSPPCEGEYLYTVTLTGGNAHTTWSKMTEKQYRDFKATVFVEQWATPAYDPVPFGDYEYWGGDC